jgi:hypothetical protein
MSDRTVHARLFGGGEIVRYDRAGRWFWEYSNKRDQVSIDEAVELLKSPLEWFPNRPGGTVFDRKVRAKFPDYEEIPG